MKIGKYYPEDCEIVNAITHLGHLELDRKKHYINKDYLRGCRIVAKRKYDERVLQYWNTSDVDSSKEIFLLAVNSLEEVNDVIKYHGLNKEHHTLLDTYGCSGESFGGEPMIDKICNGRYTLRYQWYLDV